MPDTVLDPEIVAVQCLQGEQARIQSLWGVVGWEVRDTEGK